jgi:hypothetical protein
MTSAGVFTWTPSEAQGPGDYPFDVVVSDGALTDSETITVHVNEVGGGPPVAFFSASVNGLTVNVDAHLSTGNIVSYTWSWGDGLTGTGMIATHTYAIPVPPSHSDQNPPYTLEGTTTDANYVPYSCYVRITNMRTLESTVVVSDPLDGYYSVDLLHKLPSGVIIGGPGVGDQFKVEAATLDGTLSGSSTGLVSGGGAWVDVILTSSPPIVVQFDRTITLTVSDGTVESTFAVLVTLTYFV